jgi:hypothetical protein
MLRAGAKCAARLGRAKPEPADVMVAMAENATRHGRVTKCDTRVAFAKLDTCVRFAGERFYGVKGFFYPPRAPR